MRDHWKRWNQPVHKWILRTIYFSAVLRGVPESLALIGGFLLSALFHELLVGVPLRLVLPPYWSLFGMLAQASAPFPILPLVRLSSGSLCCRG